MLTAKPNVTTLDVIKPDTYRPLPNHHNVNQNFYLERPQTFDKTRKPETQVTLPTNQYQLSVSDIETTQHQCLEPIYIDSWQTIRENEDNDKRSCINYYVSNGSHIWQHRFAHDKVVSQEVGGGRLVLNRYLPAIRGAADPYRSLRRNTYPTLDTTRLDGDNLHTITTSNVNNYLENSDDIDSTHEFGSINADQDLDNFLDASFDCDIGKDMVSYENPAFSSIHVAQKGADIPPKDEYNDHIIDIQLTESANNDKIYHRNISNENINSISRQNGKKSIDSGYGDIGLVSFQINGEVTSSNKLAVDETNDSTDTGGKTSNQQIPANE